jgi:hypothetical protein
MPYGYFDSSVPNPSQTVPAMGNSTNQNQLALRDMLASMGMVPGFNCSIGAGTTAQPTQFLYKSGVTWIKVDLTWTSGQVVKSAFYISYNSGAAYTPMTDASGNYVMTIAYDGSGFFNGSTWGSTP